MSLTFSKGALAQYPGIIRSESQRAMSTASKSPPVAAPVPDHLPSLDTCMHSVDDHLDRAICIKVGKGDKAKDFEIHRGLLRFYSGYFRKAIQNIEDGNFSEAADGIIRLPHEDPATFTCFKRWLYAPGRKLTANPQDVDGEKLQSHELCKLWCFGQERMIPMLQNRAIDLLISRFSREINVSAKALKYAYEESAVGSPLRRILTFYTAQYRKIVKDSNFIAQESQKTWFQEYAHDVAIERLNSWSMTEQEKKIWNRCAYHVHEEGATCWQQGWKTY